MTTRNYFWIDKLIEHYQSLSENSKSTLNIMLGILLFFLIVSQFYHLGEAIGTFFYNVTH